MVQFDQGADGGVPFYGPRLVVIYDLPNVLHQSVSQVVCSASFANCGVKEIGLKSLSSLLGQVTLGKGHTSTAFLPHWWNTYPLQKLAFRNAQTGPASSTAVS